MPAVLLIDDHAVVRDGLRRLLFSDLRDLVIAEAADAPSALREVDRRPWDLIMLDINLPGQDGFQLLQEMLGRRSGLRVLMLSIHSEPEHAARALRLGASGYVSKSASRAELLAAIRSVLAGQRYVSRSLRRLAAAAPVVDDPPHQALSAREQKVMLALVAGKRASAIAAELSLSVKTVSTYRRRILFKLHLSSTADLIRYAIAHQLS